MIFLFVSVLCLAVTTIDVQADCTGLPDGPCCAGCHSYTECTGGMEEIIYCPLPDLAYNELIGECDDMENVPPPCGKNHNCTYLPDRKYPDLSTPGEECEAFFTCTGGVNLGTNPCNPPDAHDLVFDYKLQLCNWKNQVPPPCGTNEAPPEVLRL